MSKKRKWNSIRKFHLINVSWSIEPPKIIFVTRESCIGSHWTKMCFDGVHFQFSISFLLSPFWGHFKHILAILLIWSRCFGLCVFWKMWYRFNFTSLTIFGPLCGIFFYCESLQLLVFLLMRQPVCMVFLTISWEKVAQKMTKLYQQGFVNESPKYTCCHRATVIKANEKRMFLHKNNKRKSMRILRINWFANVIVEKKRRSKNIFWKNARKTISRDLWKRTLIDMMAKNVWKKHEKLFLFSYLHQFTEKWLKNLNNDIHANDPSSKYNSKQITDS